MSQKNLQKTPGYVIAFLIALFVLDGIIIIGRAYHPEAISSFSCSVFPLAQLSSPLFADRLINLADHQCPGLIHEPAISIISLMFKTALAFFMAIYFVGLTYFSGMSEVYEKCRMYVQKNTSLIDVAKSEMNPPFVLTLVYCFLAFQQNTGMNGKTPFFGINIFTKLFEDLSCLVLFVALASFIKGVFVCVTYATNEGVGPDNDISKPDQPTTSGK